MNFVIHGLIRGSDSGILPQFGEKLSFFLKKGNLLQNFFCKLIRILLPNAKVLLFWKIR